MNSSIMFSCKICPCSFAHRYSLTRHEITHSNVRFPCKVCSKLFKYKTNLKRHEKNSHPDVFKWPKTRRRNTLPPLQSTGPPVCVQNYIPTDRPIEMSPIDLKRTNDYGVHADFANHCSFYSQTPNADYYMKNDQRSCIMGNDSIFKPHERIPSEIEYIDLTENTSPSPQDLSVTGTINNDDGSIHKSPEKISSKIELVDVAEKIATSPQDLSVTGASLNNDNCVLKNTLNIKAETINSANESEYAGCSLEDNTTGNNVKIEPTSLELILEKNSEEYNMDETVKPTEPSLPPELMEKKYLQAKEHIDEQKKIISSYENEIKKLKNTIRVLMDQMKNLSTKQ